MSARRVLVVTPHFPPDTSAATHRLRVLAPQLEAHGWIPTILTLTDDAYDGRLERGLLETLPSSVTVVRVAVAFDFCVASRRRRRRRRPGSRCHRA